MESDITHFEGGVTPRERDTDLPRIDRRVEKGRERGKKRGGKREKKKKRERLRERERERKIEQARPGNDASGLCLCVY